MDNSDKVESILYSCRLLKSKKKENVDMQILIPFLWIFASVSQFFVMIENIKSIDYFFYSYNTVCAMVIISCSKAILSSTYLCFPVQRYSKFYRYAVIACTIFYFYTLVYSMNSMYNKFDIKSSEIQMNNLYLHFNSRNSDFIISVYSYVFFLLCIGDLANCVSYNRTNKMYVHKSK